MFEIRVVKDEKYYVIRQSNDPKFPFWMANEDGEGMGLSVINLFDLLDKAFKDNF